MPIYAYKCGSCGHARDVLQKVSDAPLTVCPACGAAAFTKQVTAAGFQLKGSGWYVTDFRSGSGAAPAGKGDPADQGDSAEKSTDKSAEKSAETSGEKSADKSAGKGTEKTASQPAGKADAPAPAKSPGATGKSAGAASPAKGKTEPPAASAGA